MQSRARTTRFVPTVSFLLLAFLSWTYAAMGGQQSATAHAAAIQAQKTESIQDIVAKQAALVSEFEVNGLKVLVKRRAGSLTVAAGLFIRGGARNINAENAGVEALMLATATEASTNFPRERMRSE